MNFDDLIEVGCNICAPARPRTRRLFSKNGLWVTRCTKCRLVYVNPRLEQRRLWERYSEEYFTREYIPAYGGFDPEANLSRHSGVLDAVERYKKTKRFLDAGCAVGFLLHAARQRGWDCCGVEVSEFAARYGTEQLGLNIINSTMEEADLAPGSFDVVTLCDTLEHLQDPASTLEVVVKLLRAGGIAYISTPNFNSLNRLLFGRRWGVIGPTEHIYYFTASTIARLLRKCGLTPVSIATDSVNTYHYLRGGVSERALKWYGDLMQRADPTGNRFVRRLRLGDNLLVLAEKGATAATP